MDELGKIRKQLAQEIENARAHYDAERTQLEKRLLENAEALAAARRERKTIIDNLPLKRIPRSFRMPSATNSSWKKVCASCLLSTRNLTRTLSRSAFCRAGRGSPGIGSHAERARTGTGNPPGPCETGSRSPTQKTEMVRQINRRDAIKAGPTSVAAGTAFEAGVNYYQSQQWIESLDPCLRRMSRKRFTVGEPLISIWRSPIKRREI